MIFLAHKSNFKNEEHKYIEKVYTIMNLFVNSIKIFYQLDIFYGTDVSFITAVL